MLLRLSSLLKKVVKSMPEKGLKTADKIFFNSIASV